jgi:hypothetical protein
VRLPLRPAPATAAAHPDGVRGGALAGAAPVAPRSVLGTVGAVLAVLDVDGLDVRRRREPAGRRRRRHHLPPGGRPRAGRPPPEPPLGWLLVGVGAAAALTVVATTVALLADAPTRTALLAVHLQSWLWVPGFLPLVTLLPLLYPDGPPAGPGWRWAVSPPSQA